jgi:hypothetical protein
LLESLESRLAPAGVAITATNLNDSGFESPVLGNTQYQYSPTGTPWTFSSPGTDVGAGITANNSGFTQDNPSAPEGTQVGFIQGQGSISQNVTFQAGTYSLSFYGAQRGFFQDSRQTFQVMVDANVVGTFNDLITTAYTHLVTGSFTVTSGSHTVTFQGTDNFGGDNTIFLDQVVLSTNADEGTPYAQTISATGGSGSYTFVKTSGTLPTGLVLTNDGVLSGTPTAVGNFNFTVTATDSLNSTVSQIYNMTINPPLTSTAASPNDSGFESPVLGNGQYLYVPADALWTFSQIGAYGSGITGNNSGFTQSNPNAPEGNQVAFLQNTSTISQSIGFLAGTYNLSFYAAQRGIYQDSSQTFQVLIDGNVVGTFNNVTGTAYTRLSTGNFTVTGSSHTLTFQGTNLNGGVNAVFLDQAAINAIAVSVSNWTVNQPGYSLTFSATGGTGNITFSSSGSLPPGLTLNSVGVLSGRPTTANSYTFTVTATDSVGSTDSQSYTVTINPILTIATSSVPDWTIGRAYDQPIATSGGTAPMTFTVSSGKLPTGLTMSTTGLLSGTPTATGGYAFTVVAVDMVGVTASQTYTVTINPSIAITTGTLGNWTANQAGYTQTISATGGTGSIGYSVQSGTLPAGLTLSTTGVLSGTPTTAGIFTFTVIATDTTRASANQSYTVTINPPVTLSPAGPTSWTVNVPGYNQTIVASGGIGVKTLVITAGTLPDGLSLTSAGVLSGTPTAVGKFNFTVTASDTFGATGEQSYDVTISPNPIISPMSLPAAILNAPYSQTLMATGGTGTKVFSEIGTLPTGLTLSSSGVLAGTATLAGYYSFIVTATDTVGASASQSYMVSVGPGPFGAYQVSASGSKTIQAGSAFQVMVQATDQYGNAITNYSGPATVTVTVSPTPGSSNFPISVPINSIGSGLFLADLQSIGSYTITVSGGPFTGSTGPVTVVAAAPAALKFAAQPVAMPTGVTLPTVSVQVVDAYGNAVITDNTDAVTLTVASGPGAFTAGSTTSATVHTGVASFNNLMLVLPGSYRLSAVLPEHFIAMSAPFTILPLQVVPGSFAGTPSGFSLQFNTGFLVSSATPVLYGPGYGASAPVPSVTLTQTQDATGHPVNNPIAGSLILDPSSNTITFLATNTSLEFYNGSPLLADGTYTAVVHGTAAGDGLQALNFGGGFLDGLRTGAAGSGDYTETFQVGAAAGHEDVVWLPDVAEGPGQTLNAPGMNAAGGGYPIYLNDTTGHVSSVQAMLTYNPALLAVTPTSSSTFTVKVPTVGTAVLTYSGPALAAGEQIPLGYLTASVSAGTTTNPMPYKGRELLHLANVALNGGSIPAAISDGLHLVAYVGDADGSGSYSANDAVLITRALLNTDTGFTADPLVDPVIVADTDGTGFIPADAALQANEAGVGLPAANLASPPIPGGVHFRSVVNGSAVAATPAYAVVRLSSMETTNSTNNTNKSSSGLAEGSNLKARKQTMSPHIFRSGEAAVSSGGGSEDQLAVLDWLFAQAAGDSGRKLKLSDVLARHFSFA